MLITAEDGGIVNEPVLLRPGREPVVAGAFRFRCRPVGARLFGEFGTRREGSRTRGLPGPGAGSEVQGRDDPPVRRFGHEHPLLLDHGDRPRRDSGGHQSYRLECRDRVRDLSPRPEPRRGAMGADHGSGRAVSHPTDRAFADPPHRGRNGPLRRRHNHREQSRSRSWGSNGWWKTRTRTTSARKR